MLTQTVTTYATANIDVSQRCAVLIILALVERSQHPVIQRLDHAALDSFWHCDVILLTCTV
jgi:hypothetical protein